MKKIGILVYDTSLIGGAEKVAINLAKEFSNYYEVHLISLFNEKKIEDKIESNYNCYTISKKAVSITKNIFTLSNKLKKYLEKNNIDILFSITAGVNTVAILATRRTKIKTVYCEHSNLENKTYGKKHILRQWIGAKKMDRIVTLTKRDRNNFVKKMRVKENKVQNIPNWYEKTNNENIEYNVNSKKIITAGRLEKVKGHDLLIQVAKRVNEKHPDWIWDIYGDGSYKNEINENIMKNNLQNFVHLKGNYKNLNEIYNEYSIFVLTSYYEGIPLVLLEAQESKLPIVSFDCPTGPSEIIEDGENGFLISTYDVEQMAIKICELIENPKKRIQFSKKSKINLQKFEKEIIIEKWKELIENI